MVYNVEAGLRPASTCLAPALPIDRDRPKGGLIIIGIYKSPSGDLGA